MIQQIRALVLLALALMRTVLRRIFRRVDAVEAFRRNYDPDGLPPVSAEERAALGGFSGCIACGLCDRGEADRIRQSGGAYRGLMALFLSGTRSMPDYRAAAYSFSFVPEAVLREKERICPGQVPMAQIAAFVRDKADAVGGPLPLPESVPSLRPPRAE